MSAKHVGVGVVLGLLTLGAGTSSGADEVPARPPELKNLQPLIGTWETQTTVKVAEWSPKELRMTGSVRCTWVLDGRFVQVKGTDSLKQEFLGHWTYDVNNKSYRTWFFSSSGTAASWSGQWNPAAKSFIVTKDLGNGITDTLVMHLADARTVAFTSQVKGRDGKLYFAMVGKWTRRK
jgi:hypothetical protein